ncbi:MAG: hypothetical protein ACRENP_05125 [Longimicrobiales bacterium]
MADFEILGTVVEKGTDRGVPNVRVEAWDRDTRFHDMLGSVVTDGAGHFRIRFTDEYFGDFKPDLLPDVFYRVFRDEALVLSTQDRAAENVKDPRITVTLELEPVVEPAAGRDRVDAVMAMKAFNFFQQSDFKGLRREARAEGKLASGLLTSMLMNGFNKWDWSPVGPSTVPKSDVVNQDTQTAQANLAQRNVTVDRVEEFKPGLDREGAGLVAGFPVRVQPGDRVILYQENGRVKYYARVRDKPAATIDQNEVQRLGTEVNEVKTEIAGVNALRTEVASLKSTTEQERGVTASDLANVRRDLAELAQMKQTLASLQTELNQRNQTIATLQAELSNVKERQQRIERTNLVQRIDGLEERLGRINR